MWLTTIIYYYNNFRVVSQESNGANHPLLRSDQHRSYGRASMDKYQLPALPKFRTCEERRRELCARQSLSDFLSYTILPNIITNFYFLISRFYFFIYYFLIWVFKYIQNKPIKHITAIFKFVYTKHNISEFCSHITF
jgi:hypothetical protein